jgi:hypothetical protein
MHQKASDCLIFSDLCVGAHSSSYRPEKLWKQRRSGSKPAGDTNVSLLYPSWRL